MIIREGPATEGVTLVTDTLSKPTPASDHSAESPPIQVVWLPAKKRKKRYLGLWLGIPGGLIAATAALCGFILIAPGVVVGGVDVGLQTPGVASDLVAHSLAETRITFETPSKDVTLTGEQLGLSVDAKAVAQLAHGDYPLWKVGSWNPGDIPLEIDVDAKTAFAALSQAAPSVFPAPVNARVKYDTKLITFEPVNAKPGRGVDLDNLARAVSQALSSGSREVTIVGAPVSNAAPVTSVAAQKQATALNTLIASAGFYAEDKRVVAIEPAVAASWLKVTVENDAFEVTVNSRAALADLRPIVAALPKAVNRPAVDKIIVTNAAGEHLRTVEEGADGWVMGSTTGIADKFVDAFAEGDGQFDLEYKEVPFKTTLSHRTIEVNKAAGVTILYDNGVVVDTYPVAIGRSETATDEGHFTVYAQLVVQDMGCVAGFDYCTKDVPWITYFNGDEGFHGTYWHSNFGAGAMMSHGCVNMTIEAAERVYRFAQVGTEVWVHS